MTLSEIIERLEKATGPNYELEREIQAALEPDRKVHVPRPYTSSVDAAIALAEKALPAWQVVGFESNWSGPYPAYGSRENVQSRAWVARTKHSHVESEGVAATPALALCLAILKAKQMGVGE